MAITIIKIDDATTTTLRDDIKLSRFPVEFECPECCGKAYFDLFHSGPPLDMTVIKKMVLGKAIPCCVSIGKTRSFRKASSDGHQKVVPVGPPGSFEFEGQLAEILYPGDLYVFRAGQLEFVISADWLPKGSGWIEEGKWVTFEAEGFGFTSIQLVGEYDVSEEGFRKRKRWIWLFVDKIARSYRSLLSAFWRPGSHT